MKFDVIQSDAAPPAPPAPQVPFIWASTFSGRVYLRVHSQVKHGHSALDVVLVPASEGGALVFTGASEDEAWTHRVNIGYKVTLSNEV